MHVLWHVDAQNVHLQHQLLMSLNFSIGKRSALFLYKATLDTSITIHVPVRTISVVLYMISLSADRVTILILFCIF
jgi:hypothetical protein